MEQPAEYTPGQMDVSQQRSMYHFFNSLVHWGSLTLATGLIFFVSWLCAHLGFLPSLIIALIVAGLGGFWLLRPKGH